MLCQKLASFQAQVFEPLEIGPPDVGMCSQSTESTVEGGVIAEDKLDFFPTLNIILNLSNRPTAVKRNLETL
ncbi:hypothetical protein DPMN_030311 [Dreissena polymorpha]|uniref:Uncharacterized protein n=1 Tax=Dreissena polymorpha TaxID=45954 RepID=A0A9D4M051_DREPO|nr:hypothetical protein DPMN_030311 [Dreissena polymorpha]